MNRPHRSIREGAGVGSVSSRLARTVAGVRVDVSFAVFDTLIVIVAYMAALMIRFYDRQGSIDPDWWEGFWTYLPVVVGVHLIINTVLGAYGHVWEFASVEEAMRLVVANIASAFVLVGGLIGVQEMAKATTRLVPLTVVIVGSGLALGGMGAVRFRSRLFSFRRTHDLGVRRALVVGTGRACADLARQGLTASPAVQVIGFVDNAPSTRKLAGMPVLGAVADLPELIREHGIDETVIAASSGPETIRAVVDVCVDVDVRLRTLPEFDTFMGSRGIGDVRDLELADLLPRDQVSTDLAAVEALIAGRRVLVTGAGGSIGSEIVKQVARFHPVEVVALDHDESHLYEAALGWSALDTKPISCLVDVCDQAALERVMERHRPQVVFHAAAHKHVPILEDHPEEAVKTNVVGTRYIIEASQTLGVERFVLISTDQAVQPTSVMGASKRMAEMMVQSAAETPGSDTVFTCVRFGNVLGSRGSVVPTFMRQIKDGGPVRVSDPEMLRFFMLTSEAVELVLQAAALARGGEIYVLDMGEPVRIGDLAHRMIRLAGLVPDRDIEVAVTGPRRGEKLIEVVSEEPLFPSEHPKIGLATAGHPGPVMTSRAVHALHDLADKGDRQRIKAVLMALVWHTWTSDKTIDLDALTSEAMVESA